MTSSNDLPSFNFEEALAVLIGVSFQKNAAYDNQLLPIKPRVVFDISPMMTKLRGIFSNVSSGFLSGFSSKMCDVFVSVQTAGRRYSRGTVEENASCPLEAPSKSTKGLRFEGRY